ncbi:MAG: hypothetical protein ACE5GD_01435 [Candidatus Geothermarchaeales archaeon]
MEKLSSFDEWLDEFHESVEKFFRRLRGGFYEMRALLEDIEERSLTPLTTIHIQRNRMIVTADLPLVDSSSIKVELIDPKRLYVEAKMKGPVSSDDLNACLPPCRFEYLKANVDLPLPARNIASMSLHRDVLEVVLSL